MPFDIIRRNSQRCSLTTDLQILKKYSKIRSWYLKLKVINRIAFMNQAFILLLKAKWRGKQPRTEVKVTTMSSCRLSVDDTCVKSGTGRRKRCKETGLLWCSCSCCFSHCIINGVISFLQQFWLTQCNIGSARAPLAPSSTRLVLS